MSSDSDMSVAGREMTQLHKERHLAWHEVNMQVLDASGVPYTSTNDGENLLFREAGKPKADFFPSTGRWRVGTKVYRGGAKAFLAWWKKASV